MLLHDEIDIGLVPVSIIPQMKEYHINTRFCIGCDGPVASVCLFSEVPVQDIRTVILDYQSRTSVALAEILFEKHWKLKPVFVNPQVLISLNQIRGIRQRLLSETGHWNKEKNQLIGMIWEKPGKK